jgi:DNA mismatch repair protein MutS
MTFKHIYYIIIIMNKDKHSNKYTKPIMVKDYFDIHNYYTDIYGKNTIILMQVGSFHECYGTDNEGPDLMTIADKLDFIVTKKNKSKELSRSNPYMLGAPVFKVDDIIEKLILNNYVVIRIDQISEPPNPKREVTGIYTPATYVERTNNDSNNLVSITFDIGKKNNNVLLNAGLASIDLSTGKSSIYETVSKEDDNMFSLDNIVHYLENFKPKEIIVNYTDNFNKYIDTNKTIFNLTLSDLHSYIGITNINKYNSRNLNFIKKPAYQQSLLEDVFGHNIINKLDLQYYHDARLSLTALIDFVQNNNNILLSKLEQPYYYTTNEKLFLGNKALDQLDVYNGNRCLFNIINNTKTYLGRRYLKDNLNNPTCDVDTLQNRYTMIEKIIKYDLTNKLKDSFTNIYDLNKLSRRMILNKITPAEFYNVYISLKQANKLFTELNFGEHAKYFDIDSNFIDNNNNLINFIEEHFDLDYIVNINFYNYKEEDNNYLIKNEKLNELMDTIKTGQNFMNYLVKELEKHIEDKKMFMNKNKELITLKYNERDGHYLLLTKRRSKLLLEKLKTMKTIKVGNKDINIDDLIFEDLPKANNVKIFCKEIKYISSNVVELKMKMANDIKVEFYNMMNLIYSDNIETFNYNIEKVSYFDFLFSGAITATKYGYCKPKIKSIDYKSIDNTSNETLNSYFDAKELRHPIVEIINQDTSYKPHNISIGKDSTGILLYGINSSGKSTLMKSIGLNIIMAQIGYFVASKKFTYYPYKSIMTRICGNDNIFKGMSSFMVEMMELMAILKRNDSNTLVLGDEICRGTEEKSANIIVSYMLEMLSKSKTSFITATHLHQIAEMKSVKSLSNVIPMHLKVEYDIENEKLIYSRTLCEGQGEKYYGVQVAKFLMKDNDFNIRTKELEEEYENIGIKQSKYNANSIMVKCAICNTEKDLETHHINFQKDFIDGKLIDAPHIKKDSKYNLVTLCKYCHDKVDRNEIIINGYIETSNGNELEYLFSKKKSKKKHSDKEINIIMEIKKLEVSLEKAKLLLKEKHNIKTSRKTINKVWNDLY